MRAEAVYTSLVLAFVICILWGVGTSLGVVSADVEPDRTIHTRIVRMEVLAITHHECRLHELEFYGHPEAVLTMRAQQRTIVSDIWDIRNTMPDVELPTGLRKFLQDNPQ